MLWQATHFSVNIFSPSATSCACSGEKFNHRIPARGKSMIARMKSIGIDVFNVTSYLQKENDEKPSVELNSSPANITI
jgi:hypothetical protein